MNIHRAAAGRFVSSYIETDARIAAGADTADQKKTRGAGWERRRATALVRAVAPVLRRRGPSPETATKSAASRRGSSSNLKIACRSSIETARIATRHAALLGSDIDAATSCRCCRTVAAGAVPDGSVVTRRARCRGTCRPPTSASRFPWPATAPHRTSASTRCRSRRRRG